MEVLTNTAVVTYEFQGFQLSTTSSVAFERRNTMSCPYFGPSGCGNCKFFVKSTAVAVVGSNLQITIPTVTLENHQRLCICIAQAIPNTATPSMPVTILNGATVLNVVLRNGNNLYADQVRSRKVLHTVVATDTLSAVLCDTACFCPTSHTFPVVNAPAVTPAVVSEAPENSTPISLTVGSTNR